MNASAAPAETCSACGSDLPPNARFCPACGGSTLEDPAGETVRAEVPPDEVGPPDETGPVPVHVQRAEPHWFGVTPPHLLLGVATAVSVFAIVLFAVGEWPYGLILLGVGALLVAAFLEAARRRPSSTLTRTSTDARERARSMLETYRARSAATAEARRAESRLLMLESERRTALLELGAAAHARDSSREAGVRARLDELDRREAELRAALASSLQEGEERIRRARLPVQETMMVVPEPTPPPDEGSPPQPAVVPEPYPPPDEANPPEPARIPEPSPNPATSPDTATSPDP
jgi:hypothetical protein